MDFSNLKLEDLLLEKDELPIARSDGIYMDGSISIPIHPILLSKHIELDPDLPHHIFKESCKRFADDVEKEFRNANEEDKKHLHEYRGKPVFESNFGSLLMKDPYYAACEFYDLENGNGLAQVLRTSGHVSIGIELPHRFRKPYDTKFSDRKFEAYGECAKYTPANTDSLVQGLFLRRWGMDYLNAALRSAFDQKEKIVNDELILKEGY